MPGEYFVVCGNPANVTNCDLDASPDSNLIQNGAPDAVGLLLAGALVDAVSYEGDTGAPFTEGSGAGLQDSFSQDFIGVSRFPDGVDSDVNNVDLSLRCITPGAPNSADSADCTPPAAPTLVINEIDYDQPGTDRGEFVEIKNVGPAPVPLGGFALQLVNGTGGGASVYNTIALPAVDLAPGGYFVVCGDPANVVNCNLDASPDSNLIQNGAPDAVALVLGAEVIDTVSYEGNTGAPFTEDSGDGLVDSSSSSFVFRGISRFPDGVDTDVNNVDLSPRCITPGAENVADDSNCPEPLAPPRLVINEVDYDQPGTDAAEFVEITNIGDLPGDLAGIDLLVINGSGGGASVARTLALPAVSLAPGDYFVVCGDAVNVANCDFDVSPDSNLIQNGSPDAVALSLGGSILDTVSYEGDTGAPFTEGSGSGLGDSGATGQDFKGISRLPDGFDSDFNASDFANVCITPGAANTVLDTGCGPEGPEREIFEIQGTGDASPLAGSGVITRSNVVTAVAPDGFFIQTPVERSDGDADTLRRHLRLHRLRPGGGGGRSGRRQRPGGGVLRLDPIQQQPERHGGGAGDAAAGSCVR